MFLKLLLTRHFERILALAIDFEKKGLAVFGFNYNCPIESFLQVYQPVWTNLIVRYSKCKLDSYRATKNILAGFFALAVIEDGASD
jgi:hypothetical protein